MIEPRTEERLRLVIESRSLSSWQRYCPLDVWRDPVLQSIESYLDQPEAMKLFDEHEVSEAYPETVLARLKEIGLAKLLSPRASSSSFSAYHMCALNAMTSRRDTSVAVTLSVNVLGLLPIYITGSPEQLEAVGERVDRGEFAALLLSELSHGSNILRNDARAERGTLDSQGHFVSCEDDEPCTHYRLTGEKHLINGATRHGILCVCLRTRHHGQQDRYSAVTEPMKARGDFTMLWLDRGPNMTPLPRWHTLPARSADISGLRFDGCIVEADRVLGREHGGLAVIHKTLMLSRGGVAALAAGCLAHARDLAVTYAQRRNVYGCPIMELGVISDHLMRLEALDLMVSAISLKATAFLNAIGLAAAHYTVVAKVMACALAERGVGEGQKVLGARSLVRELPYERLTRDVSLYGVFDGTSHVMLEELSSRLLQQVRGRAISSPVDLDEVREIYQTQPLPPTEILRNVQRPVVYPLADYLRALGQIDGDVDLEPLVATVESIYALVECLQETGQWKEDQGTRLKVTELFATLETIAATIELCDLDRRKALGMPQPEELDEPRDRGRVAFAITWIGSETIASLRQVWLRGERPEARRDQALEDLAAAEALLLRGQDRIRETCREALREAGPS